MTRAILKAIALVLSVALPAQALDLSDMTEADRQTLRQEIRAYLLENPELIMEAVSILEEREAAAQAQADLELVQQHADEIFSDDHSWNGGNPNGDITLVEFIDYRCGFCRRAAPDVAELVESDGNIRIVVKEFPILGEQSMLAARFAISTYQFAGADAYKAVHDALIEFNGDFTDMSLRRISDALGLDSDTILAKMDSPDVNQVIAENHQLARTLDISGTPTFVMETQLLRGYLPLAAMQELAAEIRMR